MAVVEGSLHQQEETVSRRIVGIKELVDAGLHAVPPLYVRPPHERPAFSLLAAPTADHPQYCIPTIDLTALASDRRDDAARNQVIRELGCACEEWGFFQVVNHGVELAVIQRLREAARRFFNQPAEERMRFHSQNFRSPVGYSTSFNPAVEKVREWRDTLSINRFPGICNGFQEPPEICKKEVQEYIGGVEALAGRLYKAIYESLGFDKEYIEREVPSIPRLLMGINYYPPCPDPSLTLGLSGHSDVSCLTILHPDVVPGLEIKYKGTWVPVVPADPSAFVVNLADQTEILTNGKYKSIEHRVVTNGEKPRMSIACFFGPLEETMVGPLPTLVDESNPPRYKPTKFKDYTDNFASNRLLSDRGTLDFARI
ncbi:hypothetical protein GOP47_0009782 [Adiantum capillus-veneris]|uniref:Fe2OG dioxygenase domain-containing protein n=1 Tax=Adiantum capillus-veneris TaxID=13818 RepID=A0A9D4UX95_ADICA|nr:hypothetical protein GOP47_0009782 [Adiantum capillus-veneris]